MWKVLPNMPIIYMISYMNIARCLFAKAWRPLEHGQQHKALPKWIVSFRRTIRIRRGKSVRFIGTPDGIRSLVPHLIGPPSHWSPNSLVPQYIIGAHWYPISLVLHITCPPSHWSPFSLVTPSSANPNDPPTHWFPTSLVPHLIGPPTHQSPISLVPQLAPMHHPFHWSSISLVPPDSLVPHLIGPLLIGPPIHKSPTTNWSPLFIDSLNFGQSQWSPISLVPYLIGPPIGTHALPIPLVPPLIAPPHSDSLPPSPHLIGPPSHWSLLTGWAPNS